MRIHILAVGPMKSGPERDLVDDYAKRFRQTGRSLGFRALEEVEVASGGGLDAEADRLIARTPAGARHIRLDEHGEDWPSVRFAERLARWRDAGDADLVFYIGGAEGYGDEIKSRAPAALAFGTATWPHRLVRVLLAEQLYRAASILAGTPYHKA